MRLSNQLAAVVATYAVSAAAQAAILADYRLTAGATGSEALVTQSAAGALAYSGGPFSVASFGDGTPAGSMRIVASNTGSSSETDTAGAIASADYVGFTLTPNVSYSLDFTDLAFRWVIQRDIGDVATYAATMFLKSSIGGFGDSDPTLGTVSRSTTYFGIGAGATENQWTSVSFDLSSLPTSSTPVQFRLYFADNGAGSNSGIRVDNIVVNGNAVVPEPVSAGILGAVGMMLFRRRR